MNRKIISLAILIVTTFAGIHYLLQASKIDSSPISELNKPSSLPVPKLEKIAYIPTSPAIKDIFASDHYWTATLSAESTATIISTGDVMLGRAVNSKMVEKNSFTWPFARTANILRGADITFINLEGPTMKKCPVTGTGMLFCIDSRSIEGLTFAGIDVVSLANNHGGDQGPEGITSTQNLLAAADIAVVGITNPQTIKVNGTNFAFLGYTDVAPNKPGPAIARDEVVVKEINAAREEADVVIVMYHWGVEYTHQPTQRQRQLGRLGIDAGADLVLGNHSHWYQPIEKYKDKFIVYSHGNFIFDQMWSQETREGVIGKYTFFDNTVVDIEFLPITIYDYGQPQIATGEEGAKIMQQIHHLSKKLQSQTARD